MNTDYSAELLCVIENSREEAQRLRQTAIQPACLLLGLLRSGGKAIEVLQQFEGKITIIKNSIEEKYNGFASNEPLESTTHLTNIEPDANCLRLLRLSMLEARMSGSHNAGTEHLLLGILRDSDNEARQILNMAGITYEQVAANLNIRPGVRSGFGFAEDNPEAFPGDNGDSSKNPSALSPQKPETKSSSDTPIIDNYGIDLTNIAEKGGLDPVVGREKEIQRIAQILSRRKKNNPILIGEPGVGKSAIVEGLATLISTRKVPHSLLNKRIVALDMASVVAGTQYRGQFEERLRRLIQELRNHPEIILFIDEIHTIIGAGSAPGTLDAANILKPALARGEIQCIGATTIEEFKKSIEKDGALERRFQKIMLEPTTTEETLQILYNIRDKYEDYHTVHYTDDALKACVYLTERYITDRAFPDKAIDALDEAGSRTRLTGVSVPQAITDKENEIEALKTQKTEAAKKQDYELAARLRDAVNSLTEELNKMNQEWEATLKKDKSVVDADDIAEVISMISGVPVQKMQQTETDRLKGMKSALSQKVIAQDKAIEKLTRAITRNRIGLKSPNRPIGTFMFVGPTGVGKTHLVKCLAEWMFGRKDSLIRIDMSEYGEKYSTSRLVGAPPGYVGYEEGGQLTEKVRRHPYSIILLDEIEKAHPDVFNTFLQIMDEGRMTDGNGTTVDFRNTIIIMTSNSGTRQLKEFGGGVGFNTHSDTLADPNLAEGIVMKALRRQFAPEFLNRLDDIIMFQPLQKEDAAQIAQIEIKELAERLEHQNIHIEIPEPAIEFVVSKGFDAQYGARSLKRSIQQYIEDALCDFMMDHPGTEGTLTFEVSEDKLQIKA